MSTTTAAMFKVKVAQPIPTKENTSGEQLKRSVAAWNALAAEQWEDGYAFTCSYQGIVTFAKVRNADRRYPDRFFTTNLSHQLVPCDRWGYALPDPA